MSSSIKTSSATYGLSDLLDPKAKCELLERHWGRRPLIVPNVGISLADLLPGFSAFSLDIALDRIAWPVAPGVRFHLMGDATPLSESHDEQPCLAKLWYERGVGIELQNIQLTSPGLSALLDGIAAELWTPLESLTATLCILPPGSLSPTSADLDLFLCPLRGCIELELQATQVEKANRERLNAGSLAYVPRSTQARMIASADSMVLVLGFKPASALNFVLNQIGRRLSKKPEWNRPLDGIFAQGACSHEALSNLTEILSGLVQDLGRLKGEDLVLEAQVSQVPATGSHSHLSRNSSVMVSLEHAEEDEWDLAIKNGSDEAERIRFSGPNLPVMNWLVGREAPFRTEEFIEVAERFGNSRDRAEGILKLFLDRNVFREESLAHAAEARPKASVGPLAPYEAWGGCEGFHRRPDDIFVVTYPKSGTTWMQMILFQLLTHGDIERISHIYEYSPYLQHELNYLGNSRMDKMLGPRVLKTHLRPAKIYQQGTGRYVYVVRSAADVIASFYHHQREQEGDLTSFDVFFDRFLYGRNLPLWFDHVAEWWDVRDRPNVLFLRYEDLQSDLKSSIEKVAQFCGIELSEALLSRTMNRSSFEFMKMHESKFDFSAGIAWILSHRHLSGFIRQGKVGHGARLLSEEQKALFLSKYEQRLGHLDMDLRGF